MSGAQTTGEQTTDQSGEHAAVALRVIEALAGPGARLRDDQQRAVDALVAGDGARVLVVQRTGWGKSAVYWVATAIRRAQGHGPTLVVSPLLSLMRDQVAAAQRGGLNAAAINSSNVGEWRAIEAALANDEIDVVLVSPERLANPGFGARVLDAIGHRLGLLVIDEAHAVSDWGHDFRPDYRRVSDVLQRLSPATPVLATTATANERVTADVAAQLGATAGGGTASETLVLRGPLSRASLELNVVPALSPIERYAWVVDHLPTLPGSGIVYALTVADAERLATAVRAVHGDGLRVEAYTGQLEPAARERLEDDLLHNRVKALVATSALGMGYDKPDLGFVVHVGAPPSPVSYYQQVGRAGRGIEHAEVVLLHSESDAGVWDYFATATIPNEQQMQTLLGELSGEPASVVDLEARTGLRRTRVELMLKQLAVDGVVERSAEGWSSTGTPWHYDQAHYDGVVAVRRREADIMRDYARGRRCLMQLLQESLDDPTAAPCGRCSVCTGSLSEGLAGEPRTETVRAISTALRGNAHELEPRKMWPGGAMGRGRIPEGRRAETGRVIVHADAPEWADALRAATAGDQSALDELGQAAVATLGAWRTTWPARPDVAVVLRAASDAGSIAEGVAERVAAAGRLDLASATVGSIPSRDLTSADEAAAWQQSIQVPTEVAGRTVLLVVDASASQWPVTIAAAQLRDAGAAHVLPLLVHRRV
ncbi:RecQ family ATP-dependent DNA helicase [Agrococcus jejuensis]|uniref:DNA 3'-5' helicase n=1 Tax=Agrococcus jejuensis TaxID=399736 RepID=A0A1G8EHV8_9MICO|nr:DEAD/DEAH box helicase [Agrococcus jejuensis]SDH69421.1 ATP-dependent DNA helicase RecQ [Agrococcus jejuensis]